MTKILHKRGSGEPDAESLDVGEIALDTSAGAAYTKLSNGTVVEIGGGGGGIEEAPKTGKMYARKDEAWEEFATANIDDINADINELREDFENHDHALDDLSDVNAGSPARDNLLIFNGSQWVSDEWAFIDTALRFKGGISPTAQAPANPEGGDLYVFDSDGTISASWGAIAGEQVEPGKFVGYAADTHNRWYLLGNMADIGVVNVSPGIGIDVDDSKPSEPVVSVDRDEVDKWYAAKGDIVWEQNGNDIYYNDGNVGIGTDSPSTHLHAHSTGSQGVWLKTSNVDAPDGAQFGIDSNEDVRVQNNTSGKVIGFRTNNGSGATERMRIDASGRVGIGTTDPRRTFVVSNGGAEGIEIDYKLGSSFVQSYNRATSSFLPVELNASEIRFGAGNNGAEKMLLDSSGRLGIGTDNPASLLHVSTGTNTDGTDVTIAIGGSAANTRQSLITKKIQLGDRALQIHAASGGSSEQIRFFSDSTTERMRIDSSGRVGIGGEPGTRAIDEAKALAKTKLTEWKAAVKKRTAEQPEASTQDITLEVTDGDFGVMPTEQVLAEKLMSRAIGGGDAKLQVAGDGYFSGKLESSGVIRANKNANEFAASSVPAGVQVSAYDRPGSAYTQMHFRASDYKFSTAGTTNNAFTIDASSNATFSGTVNATTINGKVTDVPEHVKAITPTQIANWDAGTGGGGGATTDGRISDDQIVHWDQAYSWGNHASAGYQPAGNYLTPSSLNGYATESWVTSNYQPVGNYLTAIVAGNGTRVTGTKIEMSGSYNGTFTATGDIVAYSDARLKDNVKTLDGSKVFDMRGVSFERDGKPSSGVIAQELREIAPELVHDDGEHLGVAYGNLVGYLIEAVKELKAEVEALKRG